MGARVLVVVPPVPTAALARIGLYDPVRYRRRIAVIRHAVEAAGGTLLDLHDALPPDAFSDAADHYDPGGAARMAALAWPPIEDALGSGTGRR